MYYKTTYSSPVGLVTLASDGSSLIGAWIEGQKYHGDTLYVAMEEQDDLPVFSLAKQWLDRYFAEEQPNISELPIAPAGSDFRKAVLSVLCDIPYGAVTTYGEIARKVAPMLGKDTMAGRAVGGAVGHNPLSIIIPCHRVIGSNGKLTGYAGGLDVKIKLLELEGAKLSKH